jgi:hypothetical protein
MYVKNDSTVPILVVLSQLTPLHWARVNPGQKLHIPCGRVWFTVNVEPYDEKKVPTELGVATRVGAMAVTCAIPVMQALFVPVAIASVVTSNKDERIGGFYADGRTVIIKERYLHHKAVQVFVHSIEQ